MGKKKGKFDLTHLVTSEYLKDNETLYFVSNPSLTCVIECQPNGEYKVKTKTGTTTVHAFVQSCLGQEPPDHTSKWVRTAKSKTLYDLWHAEDLLDEAA